MQCRANFVWRLLEACFFSRETVPNWIQRRMKSKGKTVGRVWHTLHTAEIQGWLSLKPSTATLVLQQETRTGIMKKELELRNFRPDTSLP